MPAFPKSLMYQSKILFCLLIFSACASSNPKYVPTVNINRKYIPKVSKHKKNIALLTGQAYYMPECQGQVIYVAATKSDYPEILFADALASNFSHPFVLSYFHIEQLNMCMTCEKRATPGLRIEEYCEQYKAPYWALTKFASGRAQNIPDTFFFEKRINLQLTSPARLLPK